MDNITIQPVYASEYQVVFVLFIFILPVMSQGIGVNPRVPHIDRFISFQQRSLFPHLFVRSLKACFNSLPTYIAQMSGYLLFFSFKGNMPRLLWIPERENKLRGKLQKYKVILSGFLTSAFFPVVSFIWLCLYIFAMNQCIKKTKTGPYFNI